uniref:Uncharacterized protein n=1 Tax=Otolemur garnettii TaxID=30611 RepID=H0Y002_OTOGA
RPMLMTGAGQDSRDFWFCAL